LASDEHLRQPDEVKSQKTGSDPPEVILALPIKNQNSTIVTRQSLPHAGGKRILSTMSAADMEELTFSNLSSNGTTSTNEKNRKNLTGSN
jgi:hypothetical protein